MNKKVKISIIISVFMIIILAVFFKSRIMPGYGEERKALKIDGGEIVNIDDGDIWIKKKGEGKPLYVLTGGPGFSSKYLEKELGFLEEYREIIYFDPRSSGRSEYFKNLDDIDFERYAEDLEKIIDKLTPDRKIDILAHSYGAVTAYSYISKNENVDNLILVSPVGAKHKKEFSDTFFRIGLPPKNQKEANIWFQNHAESVFSPMIYNKNKKNIMNETHMNFALMIKNETKDYYDYRKDLKEFDGRVLLIFGKEKEAALSKDKTQKELSEIFDTEIIKISNSGHFSFAENKEGFRKIVLEFLE